jgi:hypothetical protein
MARFNVDDYVDVQERISRFWSEYPEGRIITEIMSLPDEFERVVFRAQVFKAQNTTPDVTGWAAEVAGGQGANQTSWHENAETSAIGRALANMGYAKSAKDRPSRQEMGKVNRGPVVLQEVDPDEEYRAYRAPINGGIPANVTLITPAQILEMGALMKGLDWHIAHRQNWLKKNAGTIDYRALTQEKAAELIALLNERLDEAVREGLPEATGQETLSMATTA